MGKLSNLHPDRVIKTFLKAGWEFKSQRGSHVKLVKNEVAVVLPYHKGKPIKEPVLCHEIKKAGLTVDEFVQLYKE
ncbi:MAG: type II toxin-antitoxin system HicA family toxin [Nitrospirae bacterium]|nr:type II toxin-antitoxin system HicA family toxin [Nitrospirota bacterium]MBF0618485.1 type II toxin-antitoxin system HicA family toxin [Nitrospirota bacterium]